MALLRGRKMACWRGRARLAIIEEKGVELNVRQNVIILDLDLDLEVGDCS